MELSFKRYIELYPPTSKMWAFRMTGDRMQFFDIYIKDQYRQLSPKHWYGGLAYKSDNGVLHLFFTFSHNLTEFVNLGTWEYNIVVSRCKFIPVLMSPEYAPSYFELIHSYDINHCIGKHFVETPDEQD